MKQAGGARGGVKPPGGCETLEAERSRVWKARWIERGFPGPIALKGHEAQEGTTQLELRESGQKAWWRPMVIL